MQGGRVGPRPQSRLWQLSLWRTSTRGESQSQPWRRSSASRPLACAACGSGCPDARRGCPRTQSSPQCILHQRRSFPLVRTGTTCPPGHMRPQSPAGSRRAGQLGLERAGRSGDLRTTVRREMAKSSRSPGWRGARPCEGSLPRIPATAPSSGATVRTSGVVPAKCDSARNAVKSASGASS